MVYIRNGMINCWEEQTIRYSITLLVLKTIERFYVEFVYMWHGTDRLNFRLEYCVWYVYKHIFIGIICRYIYFSHSWTVHSNDLEELPQAGTCCERHCLYHFDNVLLKHLSFSFAFVCFVWFYILYVKSVAFRYSSNRKWVGVDGWMHLQSQRVRTQYDKYWHIACMLVT